jgi:ketosteroid isomerase-like protein
LEALSQENVEIVRRCFAAWDQGDMDAVVAEYADDVEVDVTSVMDGSVRGRDAVRDYFKSTLSSLRFAHNELELIDAGDDVVALTRGHGVGASSGAGWESPLGYVFSLEDGCVRTMRFYLDHGKALEAAGLSES